MDLENKILVGLLKYNININIIYMAINFQKGVVLFFGILLVVILIFLGVTLNKSNASEPWPPNTSACPDYWLDFPYNTTSGAPIPNYVAGSQCVGTNDSKNVAGMNLGNKNITATISNPKGGPNITDTYNLSGTVDGYTFTGSTGACNKRNWSTFNGISWDGITYGVNNPCYATETTTITSS
jgi:hypothetical protein